MIILPREHRLIKKIVFRVVRSHIAGATMKTALEEVSRLNGRKINATITFLNEHADDPLKAKYNSNTYIQIIKQISRLHLKASVSVRLAQLGYSLDNGCMDRCLDAVLAAARPYSTVVWLEPGEGVPYDSLAEVYMKRMSDYPNIGIELPISHYGSIRKLLPELKSSSRVRIIRHPYMFAEEEKEKKAWKGHADGYINVIKLLSKKKTKIYVQESNDKIISKIASSTKGNRGNLIFGLPLGYSGKRLNGMLKSKMSVDIYVPYGKDWTPYAIYGLAGGKLRRIATALLDGKQKSEEEWQQKQEKR
ncbi:hypothetical protein M1397_01445 [Candidatus Marsarchaeota archaeon]|nr:hypothetical protein [Candidatus Marsarchaeota archaeon]